MGRYRHRPLHLFGGLGLVLGPARLRDPRLPDRALVPGERDRPAAAAHARRPARRRRHPVLLARPDQRDDHEPPRGAGALERGRDEAPRRRDPVVGPAASPLLRDVRARLSAERAGDLEPAPARASRWSSGTRRSGTDSATPGARGDRRLRLAAPSSRLLLRAARVRTTPSSSAIRAISTSLAARRAPRASAGRLQPARLALRHARRRPRRFRQGSLAGQVAAAVDRAGLRAAGPRRGGHRGERGLPRAARRDARASGRGVPRRRRGRGVPAGLAAGEPSRCLFVGKLIPLHGLETILGAARLAPELAFRIVGSGQLEAPARAPAGERRVGPWVEYEQAARWSYAAPAAHSGSSARRRRRQRVIPNKAFQALACGAPLSPPTRRARGSS